KFESAQTGRRAYSLTNEKRIQALQKLGYNEREAAFLVLAALHSGYFLRRQYNRFVGHCDGGSVARLLDKALSFEHLRLLVCSNNTRLYHLFSRPFYGALGESDNRNRRQRSMPVVKCKLMALDFVLEHPALRYLATEAEKVSFFCSRLKVSRPNLPKRTYRSTTSAETTTRCFVEKFPIFYQASMGNDSLTVSFCYIDYGARTTSGLAPFLRSYTPLFNRLGSVGIVYVTDSERHVESIGRKIKALSSLMHSCAGASPGFVRSLLDYFRLEQLYESRQLRRLGQQGLIQ